MVLVRRVLPFLLLAAWWPLNAVSAPYFLGANVCEECHEAEVPVWRGTAHAKGYKTFHKKSEAKEYAASIGDHKSPKKNDVCTKCHYTMIPRKAGGKARAKAGPTCESCHGPSSEWKDIHSEFGPFKGPEDESAEHRAKRLAASKNAKMIYSSLHFDIAQNCMSCHGLARDDVNVSDLEKLLAANHPLKTEYELVQYSQGTVRHRFYGPDVTVNKEMTQSELARFFVVGQAAKLVSATKAAGRSSDAKYKAAQQARAAAAKQALAGVPGASSLISNPTEANARALIKSIGDKDLSSTVGSRLPSKSSYK